MSACPEILRDEIAALQARVARLEAFLPVLPDGPLEQVVLEVCARSFGVRPSELRSGKRTVVVCQARWVAMFFFRQLLDYPLTRAGAVLNKTHACVLHGLESLANERSVNREFDAHVARCLTELQPLLERNPV